MFWLETILSSQLYMSFGNRFHLNLAGAMKKTMKLEAARYRVLSIANCQPGVLGRLAIQLVVQAPNNAIERYINTLFYLHLLASLFKNIIQFFNRTNG